MRGPVQISEEFSVFYVALQAKCIEWGALESDLATCMTSNPVTGK